MFPPTAGFGTQNANFHTANKPELACEQLKLAPSVTIQANLCSKVEEVRVDMADMKVESKPVELLTSVGSCVAICMYDSVHRCGGLAHIMLPKSSGLHEPLPSKYANTAVPALAKEIRAITGKESRLSAKIIGGANMFANFSANRLDIGAKNVKAVKASLTEHKIRLEGEDVGGVHGRRISFNIASGLAIVRCHNGKMKQL